MKINKLPWYLGLLFVASTCFAQTVTTFDVPNSKNTVPQANNLFGQITGYYQDVNFIVHGFLRRPNGTFITFDAPSSNGTYATSINDWGEITGYYSGADNHSHGFVRQKNGKIITFDAPNSPDPLFPDLCEWQTTDTSGEAINLAGQVAGIVRQRHVGTGSLGCAGLQYQGFLRNQDGTIINFSIPFAVGAFAEFVGAHAINLRGQIAGEVQYLDISSVPTGGFLRQPDGTITTFFDFDDTDRPWCRVPAINLFGQITGFYHTGDSGNPLHGFLRQPNGTIVTFDPTGSIDTEATSINDFGQITGYYGTSTGSYPSVYHGFVRQRNGAITTFDVPGAATGNQGGTFPRDISLGGDITGYYQDANLVLHGFIFSAH